MVQQGKGRSLPTGNVVVLGIVALDEDPLAGPAADHRRLRTVGRLIAAPCTDQGHDGVRSGGAGKSLLAFLGAGAQRVRVEAFLGFDAYGSVVLTHEGLLHVAAEVLRRLDLTPRTAA